MFSFPASLEDKVLVIRNVEPVAYLIIIQLINYNYPFIILLYLITPRKYLTSLLLFIKPESLVEYAVSYMNSSF